MSSTKWKRSSVPTGEQQTWTNHPSRCNHPNRLPTPLNTSELPHRLSPKIHFPLALPCKGHCQRQTRVRTLAKSSKISVDTPVNRKRRSRPGSTQIVCQEMQARLPKTVSQMTANRKRPDQRLDMAWQETQMLLSSPFISKKRELRETQHDFNRKVPAILLAHAEGYRARQSQQG